MAFLSSLGSSLPWIVAIIGWGSTHWFSEARERRKEARSQLDKLYEQLYAIEKLAQEFHCSEQFDADKAGTIMAKLAILERTILRVPILNTDNLIGAIVRLRRAITLSNFDKSAFTRQPYECDILQDVFSASQDMEDEIEGQYNRRYPARLPYFKVGMLQVSWRR